MTSFWGSIQAKSNIFQLQVAADLKQFRAAVVYDPEGHLPVRHGRFGVCFASWESRQAAEGELQIFMPKKHYPTEICFDGRAWPCTRKPFHQKGRTKNAHGGALLEKGLLM